MIALFKAMIAVQRRSARALLGMLLFCLMVIIIFHFAFSGDREREQEMAPHIIWLVTFLGSTLLLRQTFDPEQEEGILESFAVLPGITPLVSLVKFALNVLLLWLMSLFNIIVVSVLFNASISDNVSHLALPLGFAGIGLAAVGTTFASLITGHPKQDLLFSLLFFPMIFPLVIAMGEIARAAPELSLWNPWAALICGFDAIFIVASYLLSEHILMREL